MQDWEFLIQEKGDRQWHSPLSLTEGSYRMVARSPHLQCPVKVQVSFTDPKTSADAITVLEQSRIANEGGLIMVFPYRLLPPGCWTVAIAGEASDAAWREAITFEIAAQAPSSLDENGGSQEEGIPLAMASCENSPERLDLPPAEPPLLAIALEPIAANDGVTDYLWVAGKVNAIASDRALNFPARLRYRLTHPESGEILLDQPKSWLPNLQAALPFAFKESLALPQGLIASDEVETLQGEVVIETAEQTLASESFELEIKLDAQEWNPENAINYTIQLSNLENQSSVTFDVLVPKEIAETPLEIDLPNPALMRGTLRRSPQIDRSILPPKIDPAIASVPQKKSLQLPKISF